VDTDFIDLLGGTTGQVLSKTSATDLDFTWVTAQVGDITGVTAGTGISGGGTSGTVTVSIDTAVTADLTTAQTLTNKTLTSPALTTPTISTLTTNGDILYGTGSGALARRGIGSTGNVLTVSGGLPVWSAPAGGGGKVLQVVTATTSTSTNIASTTFTDTTLTATITPTLNTSKVLVLVSQQMYAYRDTGGIGGAARLLRGATSIYSLGATGEETAYVNSGSAHSSVFPMAYLDSPATTSATTYKTQARSYSALNSGSVTMQYINAVSSIVLMEIGA